MTTFIKNLFKRQAKLTDAGKLLAGTIKADGHTYAISALVEYVGEARRRKVTTASVTCSCGCGAVVFSITAGEIAIDKISKRARRQVSNAIKRAA